MKSIISLIGKTDKIEFNLKKKIASIKRKN